MGVRPQVSTRATKLSYHWRVNSWGERILTINWKGWVGVKWWVPECCWRGWSSQEQAGSSRNQQLVKIWDTTMFERD